MALERGGATAKTVRELATALKVSKSAAGRVAKRLGEGPWSLAAARKELEQRTRTGGRGPAKKKKVSDVTLYETDGKGGLVKVDVSAPSPIPASAPSASVPPAPPEPPKPTPEAERAKQFAAARAADKEYGQAHDVLRASTDPLALQSAALVVAARRLARADEEGGPAGAELNAVARVVDELRKSERSALELAKLRGDLIQLDDARALGGELAARMNRALARVESAIADQVERWLADDKFRGKGAEERRRAVAEWARAETIEARKVAAAEIMKILEDEHEEGGTA